MKLFSFVALFTLAVVTQRAQAEEEIPSVQTEKHPGSGGNSYFHTWQNEHFTYHGQCDLLLAQDETFAEGLGLEIQIRNKLYRQWSFVTSAAIRIGGDTLELEGDKEGGLHYWVNYSYHPQLDQLKFAGFPISIDADENGTNALHEKRIEIDLSSKYPGQKIVLSTFKEFVKIDIVHPTVESFGKTVGILGNFKTGKTLARDGATVLEGVDFGREWQVLPSDGKLFRNAKAPQFPKMCIEPEQEDTTRRMRRLSQVKSLYF